MQKWTATRIIRYIDTKSFVQICQNVQNAVNLVLVDPAFLSPFGDAGTLKICKANKIQTLLKSVKQKNSKERKKKRNEIHGNSTMHIFVLCFISLLSLSMQTTNPAKFVQHIFYVCVYVFTRCHSINEFGKSQIPSKTSVMKLKAYSFMK